MCGIQRDAVGPFDPSEPLPAPIGELEEAAVGAVDVHPQRFGLRDVGDVAEGIDRAGVRRADGRDHEERTAARRAVFADHRAEGIGIHPKFPVGRDQAEVAPGEPGDRRRLRVARMRLIGAVVRTVEEVLAELRVSRGHERGEVGERTARREEALRRLGREVEERAHPPGHVLFDLDDRRARLPQAVEPIERLCQELRERGREQTAAGDVGEVPGPAELVRVASGLDRVLEEPIEVPVGVLGWCRLELGRDLQRVSGVLGGSVLQPADPPHHGVQDGPAHRPHLLGRRVERETARTHASSRATASSRACDASATSSTARSNASRCRADGCRKPLTLRTNWSAASRTSSGGATSEPSRRRLMLLHMQSRYRDGRLNDG